MEEGSFFQLCLFIYLFCCKFRKNLTKKKFWIPTTFKQSRHRNMCGIEQNSIKKEHKGKAAVFSIRYKKGEKQDPFYITNKPFIWLFNFTRSKGDFPERPVAGLASAVTRSYQVLWIFTKKKTIESKIKSARIFFTLLSESPICSTLKYWWLIYKNLFHKFGFYHWCFTISLCAKNELYGVRHKSMHTSIFDTRASKR